ncbi:hypothetical protein SS1G_05743 [Sclerotinia sclerotiorum 1980 UF-70]|uniref:Uncharacterized protein n=1 Tax=Sclerotinia sclerotiorum (strain ATCC 18683 / 1980 / Ss-1) TaxID=665079 RepID=A7EK96_SCLS1|nr:hypothetical protein SS1G_05743 [Sclerotinia sclerotiorum 1980 UF-70]EDO03262.1 hypothetical protein SS1G_05743 [Sclerotinia sclerotiorum 1980 UF-70]
MVGIIIAAARSYGTGGYLILRLRHVAFTLGNSEYAVI